MAKLQGQNIVVYDCEIENEIDGKEVTWSTYDKMGLSVACLYDYATDDHSVFFREDIPELCARLNSAALVVGFNTTGFDNSLLRALGGDLKPDNHLANYDLLTWSRYSVGWKQGERMPSGMNLDAHLEATFGKAFMKTGHGAEAPKWWKEGKQAKVVSYCLADVKRERALFEHIVYKGWAATATHGKRFIDTSMVRQVCAPQTT
jgi:DEAD/DEAH box helicase domain-containing protein